MGAVNPAEVVVDRAEGVGVPHAYSATPTDAQPMSARVITFGR